MGHKQCEKCGELVDEAKAFCPGCGNAFVEEKTRSSVSEFDQSRRTVQLGQTMYNELLSDMGLKHQLRKGPDEKRIEVIAPAVPAPPASEVQPKPAAASPKISTRTIVIIVVVAGFLLIGAVVLVIAAAVILYFLNA